jgi:aspartyl-tRNA(Asn)/glutamyl-tRNA(Gln) amidotransferase subunit B
MDYEAVIGMEVHVELNTESKVFCGCSTNFHAPPNTNVCPVCLGMPGVLPTLNQKAVEFSVMVGKALHCTTSTWSKMDRKNYFYPDLAKNYQISQYDLPLSYDGFIEVEVISPGEQGPGPMKRIGITRAHLEEDTARNTHTLGGGSSGVDFNRSGVALLEIVTEPDIRSAAEAYAYVTGLRQALLYLGVSDCNMEEGSLRAEANISIRPKGAEEFGTKTEVKNVASFTGVYKAIDFEIARQTKVLDSGGTVTQETRGWDPDKGVTFSQRSKESAHDYRYFPEPDLTPIVVDEAWQAEITSAMPELPQARRARFEETFGLSHYDAGVLTASRDMADYFEAVVDIGGPAKQAANWIMGDLQALLTQEKADIAASRVTPRELAALITLIEDGTISGKIAKDLLPEMMATGKPAKELVEAKGLVQISDSDAVLDMARKVIADNPGPAQDFREGKKKALGFLVGQMMKASQGKVNPKMANEILAKELSQG